MPGPRSDDDRAVSELTSLLTIVVLALLVITVVGVNVLYVQSQTEGPDATFSYQYFEPQSMLLITFDSGEPIPAGQIEIEGTDRRATWAALNDQMNESTPVGPGTVVRIGPNGAYDQDVDPEETIRVNYLNETGARTTLGTWNGTG